MDKRNPSIKAIREEYIMTQFKSESDYFKNKAMLESLSQVPWNLDEVFFGVNWKKRIKRWLYFFPNYCRFYLTMLHLIPERDLIFKTFWGRKFSFGSGDGETIFLGSNRMFNAEARLTMFLIKHLKETDVFYDAGASYGFYTMLAQELRAAQIHAFEPDRKVFMYLQKNAGSSHNVYLNNVALAECVRETILFKNGTGSFVNSIIPEVSSYYKKSVKVVDTQENEVVQTITLDQYVSAHPNSIPTILKLDVEGAESLVISGGLQVLNQFHPCIAMEIWEGEQGKNFSQKAVSLLEKLSYKPYRITEIGNIEFVNSLDFHYVNLFDNIIFLPHG